MKRKLLFAFCALLFGWSNASADVILETDLTSQFSSLTNVASWTGATGYTGTGFCPMVDVSGGIGKKQVCESYSDAVNGCTNTGDIFYATVTGLTTGTYTIELYGGAAFTFGRGFGSDAFTGEHETGGDWGTHTSTTYTAGDHIDSGTGVTLYAQSEGTTYGGEIPIYYATEFPDGAATVTLENVVVGASGQIKIGMSKTSMSTNWHVIQLKSVIATVSGDAAIASLKATANALLNNATYVNVTGSERTNLQAAYDATPAAETQEAYEAVISALNTAIPAFENCDYTAYDKFVEERTTGATYTTEAWPHASAAKKTALDNALAATTPTNAADAVTKANAIVTAYRQFVESNGLAEGVPGAIDFASAIAGADPNVNTGWTNGIGVDNRDNEKYTDGSGNKSGKYYDGGWSTSAGANINMTREITLPAGTYQLQVTARGSSSLTSYTMSIGGETVNLPKENADENTGTFGHGWSDKFIEFTSDGSPLTLTIAATSTDYYQWISFNRFRLYSIELVHHNYTINAVAAGTTIKELAKGDTYESGNYTTYVPEVIEYNSQFYVLDDDDLSNYEASFTMGTSDVVKEVNYTLDESIVRFYEGETVAGTQSAYSNGAYGTVAGQNKRNRGTFAGTLAPGTYQFIGRLVADGNSGRQITLREGTHDPMASLVGNNTTHMATADFTVYATTESLYINGANVDSEKTNLSTSFDYVLIKRTGDATVPVSITNAGYATFSSPYALDLTTANTPTGLEAYYVGSEGVKDTYVSLTAINQTVAADQGILFKGAPGDYNVTVAESGTALSENQLVAADGSGVDAGNYVFAFVNENPSTTAGFYRLTTETDVPAGKAYLSAAAFSNVKAMFLPFDGTATGVEAPEAAEAEEEDGVIYNTSGQVVTKDYKGIVIKNGKKYYQK